MAKQKIEIEGEFSKDEDGRVLFGNLLVLYKGCPVTNAPPELVAAARAWLEEQRRVVMVTVKVKFFRGPNNSVWVDGFDNNPVIGGDGQVWALGVAFPEIAEAAREWARRNP